MTEIAGSALRFAVARKLGWTIYSDGGFWVDETGHTGGVKEGEWPDFTKWIDDDPNWNLPHWDEDIAACYSYVVRAIVQYHCITIDCDVGGGGFISIMSPTLSGLCSTHFEGASSEAIAAAICQAFLDLGAKEATDESSQ